MATVQQTIIRDDMTGMEVDPTEAKVDVLLVLGAEAWELDLSQQSWAKIREMLEPIVANARRVKPAAVRTTGTPQQRKPATVDRAQTQAMRSWWADNHDAASLPAPSSNGRIPATVVEAYHRHGGRKVETGPAPQKRASQRRRTR